MSTTDGTLTLSSNEEFKVQSDLTWATAVYMKMRPEDAAFAEDIKCALLAIVQRQTIQQTAADIDKLMEISHGVALARGWYKNADGTPKPERNVGEQLLLMVSEIIEGFEGWRKNLPDDKLPHYPMITVELADLLHRLFDFAGYHKLQLGRAFIEKAIYNAMREDHSLTHRASEHGKKA